MPRSVPEDKVANVSTLAASQWNDVAHVVNNAWNPYALPGALDFVECATASAIENAVNGVAPGDVIGLVRGTYDVTVPLRCDTHGTIANPIRLVALEPGVHLRGANYTDNTQLLTVQADHWEISGIEFSRCHILVWVWRGNHNHIHHCYLHHSGGSLLHFKGLSRFNVLEDSILHASRQNTGIFQPTEGVYIGTDITSWDGTYSSYGFNNGTGVASDPDDSSFNVVRRCHVSNTFTENVEFKEGTRGNVVTECVLDGTGLRTDVTTDSKNVMCKGTYCKIFHNQIGRAHV